MTYDNPVFLEQKKRRKETVDDSGFVRQYKLDEDVEVSTNPIDDEDDEDEDEDIDTFDDDAFEDNSEKDIITVPDNTVSADTSSVRDRLDMGLEDEPVSEKPVIKFNIKPKTEEKKPTIKFNLK